MEIMVRRLRLILLVACGATGVPLVRAEVLPADACGIVSSKPLGRERYTPLFNEGLALSKKQPSAAAGKFREACLAVDFSEDFQMWMDAGLQLSAAFSRADQHEQAIAVAQEVHELTFACGLTRSREAHYTYMQWGDALFGAGQ